VQLITPSSRDQKTAKNVYASTFGRSAPEKNVIMGQIESMFRASSLFLDIPDCARLLTDYGTTLTA
jgi:hypothetical protein